jgi:hypothetical protein
MVCFMCTTSKCCFLRCARHQSVVFSGVLDIKVLFSHVCSTSKCCFLMCARHQSVVFSGVLDIEDDTLMLKKHEKTTLWCRGYLRKQHFDADDTWENNTSHVCSTSKCCFLRCARHQSVVFSGVPDIKVLFSQVNDTLMSRTYEKTILWCRGHLRRRHFDVEDTWEDDTLMLKKHEKTTLWWSVFSTYLGFILSMLFQVLINVL